MTTSVSIKNRPEEHTDKINKNGAKSNGFEYPKRQPGTLDITQEPSSSDARSHEGHGKMSDESHGLISGGLDKLFKKYNTGKGIAKKVMRVLKLRRHNLATDIEKRLQDSNHELEGHGKMSDESHGLKSGGLDKLFKKYNMGKGIAKKAMHVLKLRRHNLATDIEKRLQDSNHELEGHGKMSDESHGLKSGGLDKLFKKYNMGRGIAKKVMRVLKLRRHNLATDIGKRLQDFNQELDKGNGLHFEVPTRQYPRKLTTPQTTDMEKVSVEPSIRERVQGIDTSPGTTLKDEDVEKYIERDELISNEIKEGSGDSEWSGDMEKNIEPDELTSDETEGVSGEPQDKMDKPDNEWSEDVEKYIEQDELISNEIEEGSGESPDDLDQLDSEGREDMEKHIEPDDLTSDKRVPGESLDDLDLDQPDSEWSEDGKLDFEPGKLTSDESEGG